MRRSWSITSKYFYTMEQTAKEPLQVWALRQPGSHPLSTSTAAAAKPRLPNPSSQKTKVSSTASSQARHAKTGSSRCRTQGDKRVSVSLTLLVEANRALQFRRRSCL
jgi:hypothetical protein